MAKYRKKPVEVEAIQWKPGEMFMKDILDAFGGLNGMRSRSIGRSKDNLIIETLEGTMIASPGDWIIKEPFPTDDRKFYPCKPDIFEATYEEVQ